MVSGTSATSAAAVDQQQFLQLLVAQLKAQDPMQPADGQQFTAQLAQFSMLDGIEKLNHSFDDMLALQQITQGAGLIGKSVTYNANNASNTGVVQGFSMADGHLQLQVDGQQVPISEVRGMTAAA